LTVIALLIGLVGWLGGYRKTGPNQACVVYNGGPFDKRSVRQVVPPSSGLTWGGFWSADCRNYPTAGSPRRYIITADQQRGDRSGIDFVEVPTADGIQVRLEGKISFHTTFTGGSGDQALRRFDAGFGNRTYVNPDGQNRLHPWEGDSGFGAFLDTEFRPIVDNAIRESVGSIECAKLVSSCALVRNASGATVRGGNRSTVSLLKVQNAIATALNTDLSRNLGGRYFNGFQVIVSAVRLPEQVQQSVNETQAQFADVNKARASLRRARIQKQVNDTLGRSYENCPACARIDQIKAIPPNLLSFGGLGAVSVGK